MRNLFFWWFLAAQFFLLGASFVFATAVGPVYFSAAINRTAHPALRYLGEQAAAAYERGGREAASAFIARVTGSRYFRASLLGRSGEQLAGAGGPFPRFANGAEPVHVVRNQQGLFLQYAVQSASQKEYRVALQIQEWPLLSTLSPGWHWLVRLAVIVGSMVGISYWLARKLTRPVLALGDTAQRFAAGSWDVRAMPRVRRAPAEIKELARNFDTMADRIATLVLSQQHLIENVSHEVRTPLTRLNLAMGLLRGSVPPDGRPALERIGLEVARLNQMVGRALRLSRLEMAAVADLQEVDTLDFLETVVADCDFEAGQQDKRVTLMSSVGGKIRADREMLRGALENVIRNGIRFSPPGRTVEVRHARDPHPVILVRDYGPGVPAEQLDRMFQPFVRLADAGPGFGLGLAIVERTMKLHGGQVTARNYPEGGLEISLSLPA